jgi:hypothetical protein
MLCWWICILMFCWWICILMFCSQLYEWYAPRSCRCVRHQIRNRSLFLKVSLHNCSLILLDLVLASEIGIGHNVCSF